MSNLEKVLMAIIVLSNMSLVILCGIIWMTAPKSRTILRLWKGMIYAAPALTLGCGAFMSYMLFYGLNTTDFLLMLLYWAIFSFFVFGVAKINDKKLYGQDHSEKDLILLRDRLICDLITWVRQDNPRITENMKVALRTYFIYIEENSCDDMSVVKDLIERCNSELKKEEHEKLEKVLTSIVSEFK